MARSSGTNLSAATVLVMRESVRTARAGELDVALLSAHDRLSNSRSPAADKRTHGVAVSWPPTRKVGASFVEHVTALRVSAGATCRAEGLAFYHWA